MTMTSALLEAGAAPGDTIGLVHFVHGVEGGSRLRLAVVAWRLAAGEEKLRAEKLVKELTMKFGMKIAPLQSIEQAYLTETVLAWSMGRGGTPPGYEGLFITTNRYGELIVCFV